MTPQERELLAAFLQQLAQAKANPKDADAEALIRDAVARQPDADYLLVQRAMGLDLALQAAQAQIAKLEAQQQESARPAAGPSFLGNANAWGKSEPARNLTAVPGTGSPQLGDPRFARAGAAAPAAAPSAWGSGMLSNLATTAAGVVAGSFLYQGIQGLMGHKPDAGLGKTSGANSTAANDTSENLTDDEIAQELDDSDDSSSVADGGFDSPDLG
jgi:hypothetical protein